ncbi:monocarboxylate transporter 13-like [Patiria miniata]|uniref:Major facilitator superfamily (MFS) profile domain-containing protein n=1 Tax=Patiria miniata TaxID=46514 RepID=A0A914BRH8_PATMI|nr:monocarboxylate transporter 13-like [Patiria miniata]
MHKRSIDLKMVTTSVREFNWRGFFIVLMSFTATLLFGIVAKGMGILLLTLRDQFTTHTWIIGSMVSLMIVAADLASIFTVFLEKAMGCRRVLILSILALCLGMVLTSMSTSIIHIFLAMVLLTGPGLGIVLVVHKLLVARHFTEHYTLACGVGHTGTAVALLSFSPLMQLFLDTYGWRGATLLMSGVCLHALACAAVIRDETPQYQTLQAQDGSLTDDGKGTTWAKAKVILFGVWKAADLHLCLEFNFLIVNACVFGMTCVFTAWAVYFVPHLQAKGFTPQVAASLCSAAAVGYFFGTFVWAPFIDRGILRSPTAIIVSSLALTSSFVFDPLVHDTLGYVLITFVFGMSSSALFTLSDVVTKQLFEGDRLTSAFALARCFNFLARMLAGFLPGLIHDTTGSFDLAFVVIGIIPTVTLLPIIIGVLQKRL